MPDSTEAADEIRELLVTAATGPRRVQGDAGISVEQRSLAELIEAHKFLSATDEPSARSRGLRFNKFTPGGTA